MRDSGSSDLVTLGNSKGRSYTGWLIDPPRGYIRWQWPLESPALPLKAAGLE
jgi:hypothetical protein